MIASARRARSAHTTAPPSIATSTTTGVVAPRYGTKYQRGGVAVTVPKNGSPLWVPLSLSHASTVWAIGAVHSRGHSTIAVATATTGMIARPSAIARRRAPTGAVRRIVRPIAGAMSPLTKRTISATPSTTPTVTSRRMSARPRSPASHTRSDAHHASAHTATDGASWPTIWPWAIRCGASAASTPAPTPTRTSPSRRPIGTSSAQPSAITSAAIARAPAKPSVHSPPRPARYLLTGGCS